MSDELRNSSGEISRRNFLKDTGIILGGVTLASLGINSACSPTTTSTTTKASETTSPEMTASQQPVTIPTSEATTQSPSITPTAVSTSATISATPTISTYSYNPPSVLPPLITVTGTACVVASDRVYSADHIWVKTISTATGMAVLGITTTLDEILFEPFKISLPKVGFKMTAGDTFGTIEGYKMSADLLTPVSGTVIQINDFLNSLVIQGTVLEPVINDPYNSGWMLVIQLTRTSELNSLLTAQAYRELVAHN